MEQSEWERCRLLLLDVLLRRDYAVLPGRSQCVGIGDRLVAGGHVVRDLPLPVTVHLVEEVGRELVPASLGIVRQRSHARIAAEPRAWIWLSDLLALVDVE